MAEHGSWWSLQPFLDDEDASRSPTRPARQSSSRYAGTERAYALARKHQVKLAWGTDTLFDASCQPPGASWPR